MELLDYIKTSLHLRNTTYDNYIKELIAEGQEELVRSGVPREIAENTSLKPVQSTLRAYCQMNMTEDKNKFPIFEKSFKYQLDNLRKSYKYIEEKKQ